MFQKLCLSLYGLCAIFANTMNDLGLLFLVLALAMIMDSVLGGLKYRRLNNFNSRDLKRGVLSKVLAVGIIVLVYITVESTGIQAGFVIKTSVAFMIVAELISIIQNRIVIKTGDDIPEQDAITDVMRTMLRKLQGVLKGFTGQ